MKNGVSFIIAAKAVLRNPINFDLSYMALGKGFRGGYMSPYVLRQFKDPLKAKEAKKWPNSNVPYEELEAYIPPGRRHKPSVAKKKLGRPSKKALGQNLWRAGYSRVEIMENLGVSTATVYRWFPVGR